MTSQQQRQQLTVPFAPRQWQRAILNDSAKRIVAVVHRRAGKSTALMWKCIHKAVTTKNARVVHILPYGVMWQRTGLWDQLTEAAEAIPGAIIRRSELAIRFPNGSVFQCGGADNPDSWRGSGADLCIVDEFDDTPPSLVPLVIEPMLADRDGTLVRSGTPKGNGLLQAAYDRARITPEHSAYLLDYEATGALSEEAIERLRAEMTVEEFNQELRCSFSSPNSGSYYGSLMDEADRDGRITSVPHDPILKTYTAWDLGIDDSTAIWFLQISRGGEWRLIDYIEDSGVGFDHYVKLLRQRPYVYASHILPHDVQARELGSGKSRLETLRGLGVSPARVVRQHAVADGVNAVRMVLPRCWFDAEKTRKGIHALRHYKRLWNESAQAWRSAPVHDHASHGCLTGDALVLTDKGLRRIDAMKAGDCVWTPAGYAEVEWAGFVKRASEMVRIELSDGRRIDCTPEHKIATARGFVRADTLRYSDIVLSGNEWTSILIGLFSKVSSIGYRATITAAISGASRVRPTSTARFGRSITARCRRVARSITETVIRLTTISPTLSVSMPASISGSIQQSVNGLDYSNRPVTFALNGPLNGTLPPRGSNGTARTARRVGSIRNGMMSAANSVVRLLLRLSQNGRSGVISIARWKTCDSVAGFPLVYDLTVKNHGCYQANGFLVSNSDSMRYLALGVRETEASVLDDILQKQFAPVPREYARGGDAGWMSR